MKDLRTFLIKDNIIEQELKATYSDFFEEYDFNDWINETYEERCSKENITEDAFYLSKFANNDNIYGIPYYFDFQNIIYERLENSLVITNVELNKLKNIKGVIDVKPINNKNQKIWITFNSSLDKETFSHLMNFYGYALDKQTNNFMYYEAISPKEIKDYDFKYLYHVTTKETWNKIQQFGLMPKQKSNHHKDFVKDDKRNLEYPSRIYLFDPNTSKRSLENFISMKTRIDFMNAFKPKDYIVLKIDLEKLNDYYGFKNVKLRLFTDPAYNISKALFTCEPIPSKFISKVDIDTINEAVNDKIDDQWINDERPVKTRDGREVIILKIDMAKVPNIIHGKVKMKEKLFDYEWEDNGKCIKALDQMGNPKKCDESDDLVKAI